MSSSEIIQSVAYYDNYDDFHHVNFIFLTKFHFKIYFEDYFNDETDVRGMVMHSRVPSR